MGRRVPIREFLDSIKSRQRTTCDIDYGHRLTKGGRLANIAYRTVTPLLGRRAGTLYRLHPRQPVRDTPLPQTLEAELTASGRVTSLA